MDKIMERLKKLMELSQRGDEHEAQVAAQRAAELMARHQITIAEIEAAKADATITVEEGRIDDEETAPYGKREQRWQNVLANTIATMLGGKMWAMAGGGIYKFVMVGPRDSINAARYMYMALEKEVGRLGRREMKARNESNAWRRAYCYGMVCKIHARMKAAKEDAMREAQATSTTALVAVSRTERAVEEAYNARELRQRKSRELKRPNAAAIGYRDGDQVDIGSAGRPALGEGVKKLKA